MPTVREIPAARPLLVLAGTAVLLLAMLATGPGLAVLGWAVDVTPGAGLLRDGQKWVALAMPGYVLAGAGAVVGLRDRLPPPRAALVCCVALIVVLPDLAWGVGGRISPVHYPPGWTAVAAKINADPRPVAVLPADTMRHFAWAGPAPVLDPLGRWVRAEVLTTGDLRVGGQTVPGEGAHARAVQEALLSGAEPVTLGVYGWAGWWPNPAPTAKWVLRQRHCPGYRSPTAIPTSPCTGSAAVRRRAPPARAGPCWRRIWCGWRCWWWVRAAWRRRRFGGATPRRSRSRTAARTAPAANRSWSP